MSSSPLYLAIVVVWILVLVPMLLRRDAADPAADGLRSDDLGDEGPGGEETDPRLDGEDATVDHGETADAPDSGVPPVSGDGGERGAVVEPLADDGEGPVSASRARVIARRRRRTSGLILLLAATGAAVGLGLGPWWVLVPPALLILGHLVLLREAAKADMEHRAAEREYRRRRDEARARRAAAEAAREAEIIELANRRDQVYDQYADAQLRAAGD